MAALQPTRRLNSRRSSLPRVLARDTLFRFFGKESENGSSYFQPLAHSLLCSFALQLSSTHLFSNACALFAQKHGGRALASHDPATGNFSRISFVICIYAVRARNPFIICIYKNTRGVGVA